MELPASASLAAGAGLLSVVVVVVVVVVVSLPPEAMPASEAPPAGVGLDELDSLPLGPAELLPPPLLLEEPPPQAQMPAIIAPAMITVRTVRRVVTLVRSAETRTVGV